MSKKKGFWLKAAICCAGYGVMSDSVVIPLVVTLFAEYPNTDIFTQNFIITGNTLAAIPACFLAGWLMKHVSKRKLLLIGIIGYMVGGIGCAFAPTMHILAFLRGVDAAFSAVLSVVAAAMIVELWHTETEQSSMYGWYNATSCIFSAIMTIFAGYAALWSWRIAFLINCLAVISLLLVIFFVPETGLTDNGDPVEEQLQDWEVGLQFHAADHVFTTVCMWLLSIVQMLFAYMLDVYISEKGFGNSAVTGFLSALLMGGSFFSCLIATPLMEKFRNKSLYVAIYCILCSVTWFYYYLCHNAVVLFAVVAVSSLMQSWIMVYWALYIGRTVPRKQRGICLAIYTSLTYLSAFAAPYLLTIFGALFGDSTVTGSCLYSAYIMAIIAVLYCIRAFFHRRDTCYL